MERVRAINFQRISWCCKEQGITLNGLSRELSIALPSMEKTMRGEPGITINQLAKVARYFNRGILFFLTAEPVDENKLYSAQFRTLTNQKPTLSHSLKALVERTEKQREVYIGLLEDLGEQVKAPRDIQGLEISSDKIKQTAAIVRAWLGLRTNNSFYDYRRAVEARRILVFVSNGYKGQWQIPKENPVRGFSLYYSAYPIICIKKQRSDGPQTFTLMHELGHLLLHKDSFVDDEEDFFSYRGKERVANEFAGNVLVPDEFLLEIDMNSFPENVSAYDRYLQEYCRKWCVSGEVILRRLHNQGYLEKQRYQAYRNWKDRQPTPEYTDGGKRYRYKEPIRIFGEPFVRIVLDALNGKQISLARASTYLDNLKIKDVRKLEEAHVHV